MLQEPFQEGELSSRVVITFQVMAVSRVSPGDPDPIGSAAQGSQNELGAYSGRAWDSDNPEIGRILEAAHAGQIRCPIAAPVTQKCGNLRFPVTHNDLQKVKK
jgi:hypothetical protein